MNDRIVRFLASAVLSSALPALGQTSAPEALTLGRAVGLALERAPQLSASRAAREEAASAARLARDNFHPSAWLTTSPGYTHGLPGLVAGRVPGVAGIEIRQTIFDVTRRSDALQAEASSEGIGAALERSCRETLE